MIKKIPEREEVTCDVCERIAEQSERIRRSSLLIAAHALGWKGTPALDGTGTPVGNGTMKYDLCDSCVLIVVDALEAAKKGLAKVREKGKADDLVTVCAECLRASCWQGLFMCDKAGSAGTVQKTRAELAALDKEHLSYWKTDKELAR